MFEVCHILPKCLLRENHTQHLWASIPDFWSLLGMFSAVIPPKNGTQSLFYDPRQSELRVRRAGKPISRLKCTPTRPKNTCPLLWLQGISHNLGPENLVCLSLNSHTFWMSVYFALKPVWLLPDQKNGNSQVSLVAKCRTQSFR